MFQNPVGQMPPCPQVTLALSLSLLILLPNSITMALWIIIAQKYRFVFLGNGVSRKIVFEIVIDSKTCFTKLATVLQMGHNLGFRTMHSDLDCRIVSKKDFKTSFLGQKYLIA